MSYALKIPNVNFDSVSVGRVTYVEPIPCTGITLSESAVTFDTYRATRTITATLTPADTTDVLTWASSDDRIATVDDGVITIHGIGTATITATCGNASATVTVTAASLKISDIVFTDGKYSEFGNDVKYPALRTNASSESVHMAYNADDESVYHYVNSTEVQLFPVPYGASTAKIIMSDGSSVYGFVRFYDTTDPVIYDGVEYAKYQSNSTITYNQGFPVSYGQAFGTQANVSTSLDLASYVLFE